MRTAPKSKKKKLAKKECLEHNRKPGESRTETALDGVAREERHLLIAEAAYFRAERRGFAPGYELEDWLSAEAEIETMLLKIRQ